MHTGTAITDCYRISVHTGTVVTDCYGVSVHTGMQLLDYFKERSGAGNCKRKHYIALCGELALEGTVDLS